MSRLFTRKEKPLVRRAASLLEHTVRNRFLNANESIDQLRNIAVAAQHLGCMSDHRLKRDPGRVGEIFRTSPVHPLFILEVILQRGCIDPGARGDVARRRALETMLSKRLDRGFNDSQPCLVASHISAGRRTAQPFCVVHSCLSVQPNKYITLHNSSNWNNCSDWNNLD